MKKIRFIRHGQLAPPFTDYAKLTFTQIADLATARISPSVHPDVMRFAVAANSQIEINAFDAIWCSGAKRSIETAQLLQKLSKNCPPISKKVELAEIFFDPAQMITEESYVEKGLPEIRNALFAGIKRGHPAVESLEAVLQRVQRLEKMVQASPAETILCITHSFFMRVLHLYFLEGNRTGESITENTLKNTIDYGYLQGFSS